VATGNGFFFDPLPWMIVAAAMMLISVLFWIPMGRSITRPLARMTLAAEEVANGRFEVSIHEPRADEIGRLARAINHMTSRLSAFVKGQKRFLGDVAHELGLAIVKTCVETCNGTVSACNRTPNGFAVTITLNT
jgi:two-component system, OmpR family, sensor histidine kinase CpxA